MFKQERKNPGIIGHKGIKKIMLMGSLILFFNFLFIYPEYCKYQDNQTLIKNKQQIVNAYHKGISEKEYLNELNKLEIRLNTCKELIPEKSDQIVYYDHIMEEIKKSDISLKKLYFGKIYLINSEELEKGAESIEIEDPKGWYLYGIPVSLSLSGRREAAMKFLKAIEEGSPYFKISSLCIEKGKSDHQIEVECEGDYFCIK